VPGWRRRLCSEKFMHGIKVLMASFRRQDAGLP
jgi:hypothetical protein